MSVIHDEFDPNFGIRTKVHDTGDKLVFEKEWDAQPFVDAAAEMRATTAGERWGEMRHVGFIPMAELAKMMRQDGSFDRSRVMAYLKANPALVTFDKALK
jgi:hypothetical protein